MNPVLRFTSTQRLGNSFHPLPLEQV